MINLVRTDSENENFRKLVRLLDIELAERDGSDHAYYAQFNKIDALRYVVVVYENDEAVSCGAIKDFESGKVEVKRMYTLPANRGRGIAAKVLTELELWAAELGSCSCILETGLRQPEAIRLYEKSGYERISNYGQYEGLENSVCFEKAIA